ncbi:MAG TPA: MATE family efflux transporter [Firmicutes bacterium]|nr:MATE family efflux transporter [Bacillota bacterium]
MRQRSTDFTTGSIPLHLLRFSIPMLLGSLLQALYNTVDSIWVGKFVGTAGLGAVSVSFPIIFILIAMVTGVSIAATAIVSQYFGYGQPEMVRKAAVNTVTLLGIMGLVATLIGVGLHRWVLELMGTPKDVMVEASNYLRIFCAGLLFAFEYNGLSSIFRGVGDSRTPLAALAYATILNIVLDPLMIYGVRPFPRMGIAGAAWATVISQALSCFLLILWAGNVNPAFAGIFRELKTFPDLTRATLRIGLPSGIQQSIVSLSALVVTSTVTPFGSKLVAAFGAASRLDQFASLPSLSLGMAVSALVGQNLGANKDERVKEIVKWAIGLSVLITGVITLVAVFRPTSLLALFTDDQDVLRYGSEYLGIVALSYIPFGCMIVTNGVLRGAGDTLPTAIISTLTLWLIRVPLARLLSTRYGMGPRGVWIAMALSPLVGVIASGAYYATGRWKSKVLVRRGPELGEIN